MINLEQGILSGGTTLINVASSLHGIFAGSTNVRISHTHEELVEFFSRITNRKVFNENSTPRVW